jgi:hypothetical protein
MGNNFIQDFAQRMGIDVSMFDNLGQMLLGGGAEAQQPPAIGNTTQTQGGQVGALPQAGDPGTGTPMFPPQTMNSGLQAPQPAPGQYTPPPVPNIQPQAPDPMFDMFSAAEEQYGLPAGYLSRTAQIESGGDPNAKNPNSSAGGLFQIIDGTAAQYGVKNKFDPAEATDGAARIAVDSKRRLAEVLGREPTGGELYLAHQQGAGGAAKLLSDPNALAADIVGRSAIGLNGGDPDTMTAGEFANMWISKWDNTDPAAGGNVTMSTSGGAEGEGGGWMDQPTDYSELEDEINEMTPQEQNRQARWAGLGAFSKGLGQMSWGKEVDVSDVFQDLVDRQKEARDRRFELTKSKIQEQIETKREARGYRHADETRESQQGFTTAEREAVQQNEIAVIQEARNYTESEAEEFQAEIDQLATNVEDPTMQRAAEMVRDSNYTLTMDQALTNMKVDDPELVKMLNHVNGLAPELREQAIRDLVRLRGSGGNTNINTGDTAATLGIKYAHTTMDRQHQQLEELRPAEAGISTMEDLIGIYGVNGMPTGPLSGLEKNAQQYVQQLGAAFGIDTDLSRDTTVAVQETIEAAQRPIQAMYRATGQRSDADLADEQLAAAGLASSPLGLAYKVQSLRNDYNTVEAYTIAQQRYQYTNPNRTLEGFDEWWTENKDVLAPTVRIDARDTSSSEPTEQLVTAYRAGVLSPNTLIITQNGLEPIGAGGFKAVQEAAQSDKYKTVGVPTPYNFPNTPVAE